MARLYLTEKEREKNLIIAERLKAIRESRGESQEFLADQIGIKRNKYHHYEEASSSLKACDLALICEHFGVSSDLIVGIEPPKLSNRDMLRHVGFPYDIDFTLELMRFLTSHRKDL